MAPVPEAYFPSLDKCFSGDVQLLSWKRAFLYACRPEIYSDDAGSVLAFLSHPESVQVLSRSLNPFPPPSAKTKAEFESKTAATNAETTTQVSYDLKEIKSDALWLSQKAGIDEITALRIAVLEWQNRPAARLLANFSKEEATSLESAVGPGSFRASVAGPNPLEILQQKTVDEDGADGFSSEKNRRARLSDMYMLEKSHILKTSRKLLSLSLGEKIPGQLAATQKHEKEATLRDLGASIYKGRSRGDEWAKYLQECIEATRSRLTELQKTGGWLSAEENTEEIEVLWKITAVEDILHILQILFLQVQVSSDAPDATVVLSWLNLMQDCDFLDMLQVQCDEPDEILTPIQALVSLTTLALLKPSVSIPAIINREQPPSKSTHVPYFLSKDIGQITEILLGSSFTFYGVSPAGFAFGLVLNTLQEIALFDKETREIEQFHSAVDSFNSNTPTAGPSRGSDLSLYEELIDCARTPKANAEQAIAIFTSAEMQTRTFDVLVTLATKVGSSSGIDDQATDCWIRVALLDLVRAAMQFLEYSPEILQSVLHILKGAKPESRWLEDDGTFFVCDPRHVFFQSDVLMERIFHIARSRFPYETGPFLSLCRALINNSMRDEEGLPSILTHLETMERFTQVVSPDFQGYETIREDENANLVSLLQPLPMFETSSRRQVSDSTSNNALVVTTSSIVPSSTIGQVVSDSKPAVITWHHQYSCLSFLGSWLEEWNESGGYSLECDEDAVPEIIGLFTDLIAASRDESIQSESGSAAKRILEMASDGLARQSDIVSVVFEIFERSLHTIGSRGGVGVSLDCTIACTQFIRMLLKILPSRVWPLLSRSSLLGSDGKGGMMTVITSTIETMSGEYPFLLACIDLYAAILEDAASRAVMRRSPSSPSIKSTVASDWSAGIPSHMMKNAILKYTRIMVDVYSSNAGWRFKDLGQRFKINATLADTFERVLYYAFATDNDTNLDAKVTAMFSASAIYLLDVLRLQSTEDIPFNPIFRLIVAGLETPSTTYLRYSFLMEKQTRSTLTLSIKLLQAAQAAKSPVSLLEDQLFKATPVLVKLYALQDTYRHSVVSLLDILITSAASNSANEPPSLVGHLGAQSACLFLDILAQFEKPLDGKPLLLAIWHLLTTIVSKRQQWLAVYILTGSSPRQSLKKDVTKKDPTMRGAPFLKIALNTLSNIEQINPQVALSLLEFVSHSQENWPWATPELSKHPNFFNNLISYVSKLQISSLPVTSQIFVTRIAAVTADLCAVYLHFAKEARDQSFLKTLIPLVSWFSKDAVDVSAYNTSLHANLKKNFEMRYPGCKLQDFKRSSLEARPLGRDYYYDMKLSEELLSYDFAWAGTRNQGFANELERANINLSLVEAQVGLLHSWRFLAVEHCSDFMVDREVQKSMALVARSCLIANTRGVPQEAIFERVQQTRVDFAQALVQRLVETGAKGAEVFGLLGAVWEAMRARRATYEDALVNDDVEHYRSLLNVLFLALQFHLDGPSRSAPETLNKKAELSSDLSLVVDIVKTIVAKGFRSLTAYLHEQPEKCTPKDFAILTAVLQSCLRVKNVDRLYEHIVYQIEDAETARYATTLFSWSDQFIVAGEPVYGEISISFLVKLSTIPMLAEHLAVEAVLVNLSTCRLTNALRQPKGFGPFDPVPSMYRIWTGGFLPLCLNLLYHVIRTAPEVAAFLNQFDGQLSRAADAFAGSRTIALATPGKSARHICLSMASEAYSLALITVILDRFREAGPSIGVDSQSIQELKWNKAQVKEDIEDLLERRGMLRSRIVATSDKETEMLRQKPQFAESGAENRLEEKIVAELKAAVACLAGGEE
ncbi:hypothetical protein ASPZODRAFT_57898 [Penicilliopsis zonata CBS 506.65]|uniref:Nucleoporin NUP188 n=1 Tax=Penicilliopsis zonata CBS 506.65 TaxID=1073090 RepID=A0A1L9SS19_9EURO|nr:hypothetical protein ASPZODRAFT_57898 [Penicilliopsis zonata CBS 506.65]OJJ49924.1 hypothetical protein ASPZODRAFT_57898 [Penicilliopsis zonata CBS 506.65]